LALLGSSRGGGREYNLTVESVKRDEKGVKIDVFLQKNDRKSRLFAKLTMFFHSKFN